MALKPFALGKFKKIHNTISDVRWWTPILRSTRMRRFRDPKNPHVSLPSHTRNGISIQQKARLIRMFKEIEAWIKEGKNQLNI